VPAGAPNSVPLAWQSFAMLGDEFIVAYASMSAITPAATLFVVGHAVELYLKALLLKDDPSCNVTKYSHKVDRMLAALVRNGHPNIAMYDLPNIDVNKWMHRPIPIGETSDPEYDSYVRNQELYWVAKYLPDLKYLGTMHKTMPNQFAVPCWPCNPYWAQFFAAVRLELGWPIAGEWTDEVSSAHARMMKESPASQFLGLVAVPTTNK